MFCNRIVTQETGSPKIRKDWFVVSTKTSKVLNPSQVNRLFEQDFSEVNMKGRGSLLSQEETKFMAKAKEGTCLCPGYEIPLPLKNADVVSVLSKNCELALHCLLPLKKRFSSCKSFQDQYVTFIDSLFMNGYAEMVPHLMVA